MLPRKWVPIQGTSFFRPHPPSIRLSEKQSPCTHEGECRGVGAMKPHNVHFLGKKKATEVRDLLLSPLLSLAVATRLGALCPWQGMGRFQARQPHLCPLFKRGKASGPGAAGHHIPVEGPSRRRLTQLPCAAGGGWGRRVSWGLFLELRYASEG